VVRPGARCCLHRVTARLAEFVFAGRCGATAEHLLNRAGAMSCGGCHQFSGNRPVAAGIAWPTTRPLPAPPGAPPGAQLFDFVHIDEAGEVSPALEDRFLPERRRHLERVLQDTAPAPVAAAAPAARGPAGPAARATPAAAGPSPQQAAVAQGLDRLGAAETRMQTLQALTDLESQVAAARAREAAQPGAFMPYRRVH
jgi:hypothetical protein